MNRHQFAKQVFRLLDFNLYNTLLVVLASYLHLTVVRGQDQKGKKHKLKHRVYHIGLKVEHLQTDEEEVLRDQCNVENDLNGGEDAEWDGSRNDDDCLVDAKGHLLRLSE